MKQAILIAAHTDIGNLLDIINYFDDDFEFYIHMDRKTKTDLSSIKNFKNVRVFNKYDVKWGGINFLNAILLLCREALMDKENRFFYMISGQDFPVKSLEYYKTMDKSHDYLEFFELLSDAWRNRFEYFHLYDIYNVKKLRHLNNKLNIFKRLGVFNTTFVALQKLLKLKRKPILCFPKIFGGSNYWNLKRTSLEYVIAYTDAYPDFLHRLKYVFAAEEMYFQTILLNSEYANEIVNDNLRYIDWTSGRGLPAFLDITDFTKIRSSNKIFARKFNGKSEELKQMIYYCIDSKIEQ